LKSYWTSELKCSGRAETAKTAMRSIAERTSASRGDDTSCGIVGSPQ
jgi:hypothetical protein